MFKIKFFILLCCSFSAMATSQHPSFAKLKAFRNYFTIKSVSKPAYRFRVFYSNVEGDNNVISKSVHINEDDVVNGKADLESVQVSDGTRTHDPKKKIKNLEVPASLADLEEKIRNSKEFKNKKRVWVQFLGLTFKVNGKRFLTTATGLDALKVKVPTFQYNVMVDKSFNVVHLGVDGSVGAQWICDSCQNALNYIDYVVPPQFEGRPFINDFIIWFKPYGEAWEKDPENKDFIAFKKSFASSIKSFVEKTYTNPIAKIVEEQEDSLLPANFTQSVLFVLHWRGEFAGEKEIYGQIDVEFPTNELLAKDLMTKKIEIKKLGVKLDISFSGKTGQFIISGVDSYGQLKKREFLAKEYRKVAIVNDKALDNKAFSDGFVVKTTDGLPQMGSIPNGFLEFTNATYSEPLIIAAPSYLFLK